MARPLRTKSMSKKDRSRHIWIARNLYALKRRRGLSYLALERLTGLSGMTLQAAIRNPKGLHSPTIRTLGRLADALQVNLEEITNEAHDMRNRIERAVQIAEESDGLPADL